MRRLLRHAALALVLFAVLPAVAALPAPAAVWTAYDRPAQYGVHEESNVPIAMSDGVVLNAEVHRPDAPGRFPVLVTMTPYNGGSGVVGGANDYFVAARLRARGRRRPRHRQLAGHLGRPRPTRAARRLRARRVGGAAAVERRQGRHVRRVLHGDHAALHRRAAAAAPEGDLPDPADGRRVPRHGLPRRPEQHRLHPVLARARLGQRADPARRTRSSGNPDDLARGLGDAGVACARLPRLRRRTSSSTRWPATAPTTARAGRRHRRSRSSTRSRCRRSSSAACTTSSSAASRCSTSG